MQAMQHRQQVANDKAGICYVTWLSSN